MTQQRQTIPRENLTLAPEDRLCPQFDPTGVSWDHSAQIGAPDRTMVLDNCPEEHIM